MISDHERLKLIEKISIQIENCKNEIVDIADEIKDLEAVKESLEGYRVVSIN